MSIFRPRHLTAIPVTHITSTALKRAAIVVLIGAALGV
jgi:hypothetical protein